MRVNVAVWGLHLQHLHVRHLAQAGVLQRFYFAHRRSTDAASLGVPEECAENLWPMAYAMHGHLRLIGHRGAERLFPLYTRVWQMQVMQRWQPCDVLYLVMHGDAEAIIRRAKRDGSVIIGHPVNAHPATLHGILAAENERPGLGPYSRPGHAARIERECAACDWLVAPSAYVARSYVEHGFDPARIRVAHYAANLDRFFPAEGSGEAPTRGTFRAVCVAQVTPRKGQGYLLEAWRRLDPADAELLMIGSIDPAMRPVLAPYDGRYRHIVNVPNPVLRDRYLDADVFILPTLSDGFAIVCAEAMACGLPVITTDQAGAAELVEDGVTGFVVGPRDVDGLARALDALYRDPARRRAMGAKAAERARSWTWREHAGVLLEAFAAAVDGPAAPD